MNGIVQEGLRSIKEFTPKNIARQAQITSQTIKKEKKRRADILNKDRREKARIQQEEEEKKRREAELQEIDDNNEQEEEEEEESDFDLELVQKRMDVDDGFASENVEDKNSQESNESMIESDLNGDDFIMSE